MTMMTLDDYDLIMTMTMVVFMITMIMTLQAEVLPKMVSLSRLHDYDNDYYDDLFDDDDNDDDGDDD